MSDDLDLVALDDLDATLESTQAAVAPDDDRRDALLEPALTEIDAALAVQSTWTPRASTRRAARDPVGTAPRSTTSMRVATDVAGGRNLESGVPRIGRRRMLQITSAGVLAGVTGALIGWAVAYAWLI